LETFTDMTTVPGNKKCNETSMFGNSGGQAMDSPLNYDGYLKVSELISLQICQSNPPHHDEMLFIIIHQAYELWFRLILHECDKAIAAMNANDAFTAERQLGRVVEIQRVLIQQIHILETMLPIEFLAFRDRLKPASGFQSGQFREIEFTAGLKDPRILKVFELEPEVRSRLEKRLNMPTLGDAFYTLLSERGMPVPEQPSKEDEESWNVWQETAIEQIVKIYTCPAEYSDLFRLAERLIEFDENLSLWRFHHIRMVERTIGFKQGTGGSEGVGYLQQTIARKAFPELWQARTHLLLPPSN
jgi:tryptophan 2,3-dioxygenase